MKECIITADVYAHWSEKHPSYRVYVDGELLTERDFIWSGHDMFVRENIVVNLAAGQHNLNIEQINGNGTIQVKYITVNQSPSTADFTTGE